MYLPDLPLYFQILGSSPLKAGILTIPFAVGSTCEPRSVDRYDAVADYRRLFSDINGCRICSSQTSPSSIPHDLFDNSHDFRRCVYDWFDAANSSLSARSLYCDRSAGYGTAMDIDPAYDTILCLER